MKDDWYKTIENNFEFIEEDINEQSIKMATIEEYKKKIKSKVQEAAFRYYKTLQNTHKKTKSIKYDKHIIQPYLTNNLFDKKEIKLIILLRSRCHPAKMNFEKLNKFNLRCSLKCNENETQEHVFEYCEEIIKNMKQTTNINLENIFGTVKDQKEVVINLIEKENIRKSLQDNLIISDTTKTKKKRKPLPGGKARTQQI